MRRVAATGLVLQKLQLCCSTPKASHDSANDYLSDYLCHGSPRDRWRSIIELAQQHGTPDLRLRHVGHRATRGGLAVFGTIRYAQKACSNIAILDRLRKLGVVVDAGQRW